MTIGIGLHLAAVNGTMAQTQCNKIKRAAIWQNLAANQLREEAISSVISKMNSSAAQLIGSWPVMKSSVLRTWDV